MNAATNVNLNFNYEMKWTHAPFISLIKINSLMAASERNLFTK